jgi:hypothetical protein
MRVWKRGSLVGMIFGGVLLPAVCATAQHVSVWVGGGIGSFLAGGAHQPNGHKFGAGAVSLFSDRFRLRYVQGSLERSRDLPTNTGDNDMDYFGFDFVVTRKATGWPVDVAAGVSRFEEAYHEGYPDRDLGGRVFVHRWGPHVSALRSFPVWRFFEVWAESDLHYIPYQPRQLVTLINVGIGAHF